MFLSILTVFLTLIAYLTYLAQIHFGDSGPNPSSWTIWAFLSTLNAFSFWKASGDARSGTQYFVGCVMSNVVFWYSLFGGKFAPLKWNEIMTLGLGVVVCFVWFWKRNAAYASVGVAIIVLYSFYPTILGVIQNPGVERSVVPWLFWTLASITTLTNVISRWQGKRVALVVPITNIVCYGTMMLLTL